MPASLVVSQYAALELPALDCRTLVFRRGRSRRPRSSTSIVGTIAIRALAPFLPLRFCVLASVLRRYLSLLLVTQRGSISHIIQKSMYATIPEDAEAIRASSQTQVDEEEAAIHNHRVSR